MSRVHSSLGSRGPLLAAVLVLAATPTPCSAMTAKTRVESLVSAAGAATTRIRVEEVALTSVRPSHRVSVPQLLPEPGQLRAWANATEGNLCFKNGNLLPEFWLLGAAKAGTSSVALDLSNAGIRSTSHPDKESHQFDGVLHLDRLNMSAALETGGQFFASFEPCPTERKVLGDFTPDNLRNVFLPQVLFKAYGDDLSARLKFMIMVREPLARFKSGYWYGYTSTSTEQFAAYTEEALRRPYDPQANPNAVGQMDFRVYASMYGAQLRSWRARFSAGQFYIMPMSQYFSGFKDAALQEVSAWMQVDFPLQRVSEDTKRNGDIYNDYLPPSLERGFRDMVQPDVNLFVSQLANDSTQGMRLGGYTGRRGSQEDVRAWLQAGW